MTQKIQDGCVLKNKLLEEEGYKLFRFTESQIKESVTKCVAEVI